MRSERHRVLRQNGEIFIQQSLSDGYKDGVKRGKEQYGQHSRGTAHCTRATKEQVESWGRELWGWCDCGKAIEGRWIGLASFCPWCGRVMEWEKDGDTN